MTWRVRGLQSSPKAPILIIAFAVVLLALAPLVVASAVSELTSKGNCTTEAKIKIWQGDIEFSHQCVRTVTINRPRGESATAVGHARRQAKRAN